MGVPAYWPGISIKDKHSQAHCLTWEQGLALVRALQARLDEVRAEMKKLESSEYGVPNYLLMLEGNLEEMLEWVAPGEHENFDQEYLDRVYANARKPQNQSTKGGD